ncbi:hypothetical protein KKH23_02405 [Patescibacteria group bacterium]|nr:hypothetical protein [Patescibacteria group bacterium]MBU0777391.1 hypothetical protein [Patescibacteria group bacterium]MBU0846027.1 hypothetical protein [Patescibacteria group bacterium]MBU0922473.1 hypothetical protein [Patescibacteria group bacterium]MBU1066794.1 hypothetical protein [Patescibacteria group bacterium]
MKKFVFILTLSILFCISSVAVKAESLLVVNGEGDIIWKVLSSTDSISLSIPEREHLEITDVAASFETTSDAKISLEKEDGSISLSIDSSEGNRSLDVTNWQDDLIEVEERGETKKLAIRIIDGEFNIEQKGISVTTSYPINIDPNKNEISVQTPSGARFLSVLPIEAAESALRAKVITRFTDKKASLIEGDRGELVYVLSGEKVLNLFNLLDYPVEVEASVSVLTGEIVHVEQPPWLIVLSYLFG